MTDPVQAQTRLDNTRSRLADTQATVKTLETHLADAKAAVVRLKSTVDRQEQELADAVAAKVPAAAAAK